MKDNQIGDLVFHPAIYQQDFERIKATIEDFLEEGGEINQKDNSGKTIFGFATFSGAVDIENILEFLKTKGSDCNIGEYYKKLPRIQREIRTMQTSIIPPEEAKTAQPTQSPSISPQTSASNLSSEHSDDLDYKIGCPIF
jgi:hypothetical protein